MCFIGCKVEYYYCLLLCLAVIGLLSNSGQGQAWGFFLKIRYILHKNCVHCNFKQYQALPPRSMKNQLGDDNEFLYIYFFLMLMMFLRKSFICPTRERIGKN